MAVGRTRVNSTDVDVSAEHATQRLDRYLADQLGISRARVRHLLEVGRVQLGEQLVVLLLGDTKRGTEQRVTLTNQYVISYLKQYYIFRQTGGNLAGRLFRTSYARIRRLIFLVMDGLGISHLEFRTHSFRREGATELILRGVPFQDVILFGRWMAEKAAREYIRRGEVSVHRITNGLSMSALTLVGRMAGMFYAL